MKKWSRWIVFLFIMVFCFSVNANASEGEKELDSDEKVDYEENGLLIEDIDQYVDGIYNTSDLARTGLTGIVRLAQGKSKLQASYSTSYTYDVDKIGVKNVKLEYKGSLKVWHTIVTLDNRYVTNDSTYAGYFTCDGTFARTYRLKATHYVTINGSTQTKNNVTGELTFH